MNVLITGATGFVGRHLLAAYGSAATGWSRIQGDVTRALPAIRGTDVVFHCAAAIDDVDSMDAVNVRGTSNVLDAAIAGGVRNFVFLSTGGVNLDGAYAETKRRAEEHVLAASTEIDVKIVRLYFPYGPLQDARRLIPRLIGSVREGKEIAVRADGGPSLSLTYIADVVEALRRIGAVSGSHVLDLGGPAVALADVAMAIGAVVGQEPVLGRGASKAQDLIADMSELVRLISCKPEITLARGLEACARS
jgi:nucleoside-diphosphate-sugar epimerase